MPDSLITVAALAAKRGKEERGINFVLIYRLVERPPAKK